MVKDDGADVGIQISTQLGGFFHRDIGTERDAGVQVVEWRRLDPCPVHVEHVHGAAVQNARSEFVAVVVQPSQRLLQLPVDGVQG